MRRKQKFHTTCHQPGALYYLPWHSVHVDGEVGLPVARGFRGVRALQRGERGLDPRSEDEPEALGGGQDGELGGALALVRRTRHVAAERRRDGCAGGWEKLVLIRSEGMYRVTFL